MLKILLIIIYYSLMDNILIRYLDECYYCTQLGEVRGILIVKLNGLTFSPLSYYEKH